MSHSGKQLHEMGLDSLSDRFQSCNLYHKKPDFRELDLGSRNSPLVSRRGSKGGGGSNTATSTSSPSPLSNKTPFVKQCNGNSKPDHRRSMSSGSPLIYSGCYNSSSSSSSSGGGSSATNSGGSSGGGTCLASVSSPNAAMYPTGNICPSGKILKSNMGSRPSTRPDTLGSGSGNYGHGSIVRNTHSAGELAAPKGAMSSSDPEDLKKAGNELYRKGNFVEALLMYDRAIAILPENAAYRSNRAAALTMVGRLGEAVTECEEAVRLDPGYGRAHQRLASLYLRLGQVENARRHLCSHTQQSDKAELQKLILLEKHLKRCVDARKVGDWKSALRECDAALVEGADSSPQITACKAEAFLKLNKLENADSSLSSIMKLETYPTSCSQTKFFGMLAEAYVFYVQAKVDMAFGRFENAVAAAEKASLIDFNNIEIAMLLNNVKLVIKARSWGKDLFDSGRFSDACTAFGEGLKYDLSNSVLYCNRAVCWSKLKLWDESVEDCNRALKIQPNYTKALLRRAVSNAKLERWAAAVKDYEVLKRELPGDNEVAESLLRAQVALKRLRLEEFHNASCTGEVEEVSSLHRFKAAISSPGLSVVFFKAASNQQCQGFSSLSIQYPSINFLKVDVEDSPEVAQAESIRTVPTFNVYKNGVKVREMISPSHQELESFLRQQSL